MKIITVFVCIFYVHVYVFMCVCVCVYVFIVFIFVFIIYKYSSIYFYNIVHGKYFTLHLNSFIKYKKKGDITLLVCT